jgi:hypothetical protein
MLFFLEGIAFCLFFGVMFVFLCCGVCFFPRWRVGFGIMFCLLSWESYRVRWNFVDETNVQKGHMHVVDVPAHIVYRRGDTTREAQYYYLCCLRRQPYRLRHRTC